jgi:signal transduction histidine kinase
MVQQASTTYDWLSSSSGSFSSQLVASSGHARRRVNDDAIASPPSPSRKRESDDPRATTEWLGGIVHDLNNNMQITISLLELIQLRIRHGALKDVSQLIEHAVASASLASTTGRRLIALSSGQETSLARFDLKDFIVSLEPLLGQVLGNRFSLMIPHDVPSLVVACDSAQLQNAVLNLVLNARDAMPNGGKLAIDLRRAEPVVGELPHAKGRYACLAVTDSGCGMAADVLDQACKPFFTTKSNGRGTGLGLANIKQFAEAAGGHIDIKSKLGIGTSVAILLPESGGSASNV